MRHLTFAAAVTYLKDELGLEVKQSYLYRMSSLGQITFFGVGKQKVCTEADLLAFIENQQAKAQHKADQANKQPTPRRGGSGSPTYWHLLPRPKSSGSGSLTTSSRPKRASSL